MTSEYSKLLYQMDGAFSLGEIRTLCVELDIDYDNIPGETKQQKIGQLILVSRRNDRLEGLVALCREKRPLVDWSSPQQVAKEVDPNDLFSQATTARLLGNLGESFRLYRIVKDIDPYYPGVDTAIKEVETELSRSYVGPGAQVSSSAVLRPSPPTPAPVPAPTPSPAPAPVLIRAIVFLIVMALIGILIFAFIFFVLGLIA